MAMKLNNVDAETIKKVGRWTSSTFLIYIHSQIAALNAGLAQQWCAPFIFKMWGAKPPHLGADPQQKALCARVILSSPWQNCVSFLPKYASSVGDMTPWTPS
jgi:hypothetical protein